MSNGTMDATELAIITVLRRTGDESDLVRAKAIVFELAKSGLQIVSAGSPIAENAPYATSAPGMSLRDWFAAQALAGIAASPHISDHAGLNNTDAEFLSGCARRALMFADAIIVARSVLP